jgi:hypothetical protein
MISHQPSSSRRPSRFATICFKGIGSAFSDIEETVLGRPVGDRETLFTRELKGGRVELRDDRPALLISSTSWTPDEDFGLLLDALVALDRSWSAGEGGANPPHLLVVVTGKGPERAMYEERISRMALQYVHIKTMWLEMVRARSQPRTRFLWSQHLVVSAVSP